MAEDQSTQGNMEQMEARWRGEQGERGDPGVSRVMKLAAIGLLILVVLTAVGNLWATHDEIGSANAQAAAQHVAARRAGEAVEQKLCHTLDALRALQPPPGSAAANPSRAYEQGLHQVLDRLGPDLGCK